jgi:hypothetical protein
VYFRDTVSSIDYNGNSSSCTLVSAAAAAAAVAAAMRAGPTGREGKNQIYHNNAHDIAFTIFHYGACAMHASN